MAKEFPSAWFDRLSVRVVQWAVVIAVVAAMAWFGR